MGHCVCNGIFCNQEEPPLARLIQKRKTNNKLNTSHMGFNLWVNCSRFAKLRAALQESSSKKKVLFRINMSLTPTENRFQNSAVRTGCVAWR